jgi:hypothetical protein
MGCSTNRYDIPRVLNQIRRCAFLILGLIIMELEAQLCPEDVFQAPGIPRKLRTWRSVSNICY